MTRREQRELAFKLVFEQAVTSDAMSEIIITAKEVTKEDLPSFALSLCIGVDAKLQILDETINKYSEKWKTDRLSKVSLAVLRLCVYEIMNERKIPVSVSINEAVEIAKIYGDHGDSSYINGVLSSISKNSEIVCKKSVE